VIWDPSWPAWRCLDTCSDRRDLPHSELVWFTPSRGRLKVHHHEYTVECCCSLHRISQYLYCNNAFLYVVRRGKSTLISLRILGILNYPQATSKEQYRGLTAIPASLTSYTPLAVFVPASSLKIVKSVAQCLPHRRPIRINENISSWSDQMPAVKRFAPLSQARWPRFDSSCQCLG